MRSFIRIIAIVLGIPVIGMLYASGLVGVLVNMISMPGLSIALGAGLVAMTLGLFGLAGKVQVYDKGRFHANATTVGLLVIGCIASAMVVIGLVIALVTENFDGGTSLAMVLTALTLICLIAEAVIRIESAERVNPAFVLSPEALGLAAAVSLGLLAAAGLGWMAAF